MKPSIQLAFFFALFAAPTWVCAGEKSAAAAGHGGCPVCR